MTATTERDSKCTAFKLNTFPQFQMWYNCVFTVLRGESKRALSAIQ